MSEQPIIQIKDLKKVYQVPGGEVVALNGINLSIERGQIYGIIGMSGAGKSTLIRCINKLDTPTEGQVLIGGKNVLAMSQKELLQTRRRTATIFPQFPLNDTIIPQVLTRKTHSPFSAFF